MKSVNDPRALSQGHVIPTPEGYCDQPYIVRTADDAWLCCLTTAPGQEGALGQRVLTFRSADQGGTWSAPVAVEPEDRRENSYAVMFRVPLRPEGNRPAGRIYIFYNHNTENRREVLSHDGKTRFHRVDSLGSYVFKFSDDHGRSWSAERFPIPVRLFECDRRNIYGGAVRFFWNVGRPFQRDDRVYVPLTKVGQMGRGFFQQSEGVLLASDNLLFECDPRAIRWITLPDGEVGLRTPEGGGPIAEEHSYCVLSDGSLYGVYRSVDGYPVESYSRDGGHTWRPPRYKCYAEGGRMKNPRAANFVWRCANGRYLYWFHNHGGKVLRETVETVPGEAYNNRNPAWLSAGLEIETGSGLEIAWSEPEIALYDDDPFVRISYPDLVEEGGRYFLTETQKHIARVHELPTAMLEGMWESLALQLGKRAGTGLRAAPAERLLALPKGGSAMPERVNIPSLPLFCERSDRPDGSGVSTREGITFEFAVRLPDGEAGRWLLDNRDETGRGFCVRTLERGALEIVLCDGQTENGWSSDPVLSTTRSHHVVITVDGGPRLILFIVDGRVCDGGEERQFGWGRFSPHLQHIHGAPFLRLSPCLIFLNVYSRCLKTYEAVQRAIGFKAHPGLFA